MIDTTSILAPLDNAHARERRWRTCRIFGHADVGRPGTHAARNGPLRPCAQRSRSRANFPHGSRSACLAGSFAAIAKTYHGLGRNRTHQAIAHAFDVVQHLRPRLARAKPVDLVANFSFYIDSLTLLWMLFVTGLATLIALYASEYMSHDVGAGYCRFFAAFNLFVFSMSCLVMGDNLILLYLGWEGVGLCSYLLIGYFYKKPSAVAAAKKAFIVNRIGDLFLALGILLTFVHFGTSSTSVIFENRRTTSRLARRALRRDPVHRAVDPAPADGRRVRQVGQLPLYVWLPGRDGRPDAGVGAHPRRHDGDGGRVPDRPDVSALPVQRVCAADRSRGWARSRHCSLPRSAWRSSTSNASWPTRPCRSLGYMFAGLGVLSNVGGVFHVVTHAFFKALLFLCCGAVMHGFGGQLDLRKLRASRR
jgi:NADH-quinone oxidoreductase subunit L